MDSSLISVRDARECVLRCTQSLGSELIDVMEALDRVLALDVKAATDVPGFACSAMDGYAIKATRAHTKLAVIGESRAGAPSEHQLDENQAIRISTGAAVPAGATAVIRQEDVDEQGGLIETHADVGAGENIRRPGEDMREGTTVLTAGTAIRAAELGAAVAAGAGSITVATRPRAVILSTGDELRAPGEPLGPGEIHNSNGPMLAALARRAGALVDSPQRLPDHAATTQAGLAAALDRADVVLISGGVSVGPHDHVKAALARLDVIERFWGVALQPGKPTWFGTKGRQLVFGLPGNPVSAVVTFTLFARPAIRALQGAAGDNTQEAHAVLGVAVRLNPRREQALRVRLERGDGRTLAVPNGPQGSHIVSSLLGADALAMIPSGDGELQAGSRVALEQLQG